MRSHGLTTSPCQGVWEASAASKTRAPLSGRHNWNSLADGYFNQAAAGGPCGFLIEEGEEEEKEEEKMEKEEEKEEKEEEEEEEKTKRQNPTQQSDVLDLAGPS